MSETLSPRPSPTTARHVPDGLDPAAEAGCARLAGSVVVISGTAHGIGRAAAWLFAANGAAVVGIDIDAEAGARTHSQLAAAIPGAEDMFVHADLAHRRSVVQAAEAILERHPVIHGLSTTWVALSLRTRASSTRTRRSGSAR